MDEALFDKYICCLEKNPDTVTQLIECEKFFTKCCNRLTTCCPGDTYPANPNCCDPKMSCCDGDTY